jgi:hypothetical protein
MRKMLKNYRCPRHCAGWLALSIGTLSAAPASPPAPTATLLTTFNAIGFGSTASARRYVMRVPIPPGQNPARRSVDRQLRRIRVGLPETPLAGAMAEHSM